MDHRRYSLRMRHLAVQACRQHPAALALWVLRQLAVRIVALLPVFIYIFLDVLPLAVALPASGLLYLLIVYPARFRAALTLTRMVREADASALRVASYPACVASGLMRLLTGSLWGLPFAALLYRTYQYIFVLPGSRFNRDFLAIGAFLSASAAEETQLLLGSAVFFGAMLLSLLLFLYGWHRGVAFDFQLVGNVSPAQALRNARRACRQPHVRSSLRRNALVHALLCLPAIVLPPLVLFMQLGSMLTGRAMEDLQLILVFFQAGMVSGGAIYLAAALLALLYFPLLPYRKLRNAAAVVNAYAPSR